MSNKHIENLTFRLLQALDKNYDVVNMDAVLSVIAALESTKITKEQLEATRLAKYINLFRRRTKSEQLAKRAKSLLKRLREMVGMQQRPLSSCNELIRNESGTSSNFQENINLVEGAQSLQQNSAVSYTTTTRNIYSNISNTDKTLEHYKSSEKIPIKTVPTSFSNVLSDFSRAPTDRTNPPSFTNFNVANGPSVRRKISNLKRSADSLAFSEAFTFKQQSNLQTVGNSASVAVPTKKNANTEPIIIDIEDSNSGLNLMESTAHLDKESKIVVVGSTADKPNKLKKTKKDKKRMRGRDDFPELLTPLVVIDAESSLSQQSNLQKLGTLGFVEKELPTITDEKSRSENLIVTNMSEILSLSNSSMSSVFPTSSVGATKNRFSQQQQRPLSESDLSFAGKFTPQSGSAVSQTVLATAASDESKSNFYTYNDASEVKLITRISSTTNTFQPFTGTGCTSNDSASNSRQSTFEIIDYSSQGNKTQPKRLDADLSLPVKRPKFLTSKDVIDRQQPSVMNVTIQPQSNLNTSSGTVVMPEQKVPKKRGRKKGSKGIDSLIAKDTSLSSQMLIQSLGSGTKKVKTTKELYAEMQNRKLGVSTPTTPSLWTGNQSQSFVRRDSFCSEPSLHSPRTFDACSTNATVSTIATSPTPEKICLQRHTVDIDSGSDSLISGGQSRESVSVVQTSERTDNFQNSSSSKFLTELSKKKCSSNMLIAIENQLRELAGKLPAIPRIEKIEMETENDTVPCTCKILEILPKQAEQDSDNVVGNLLSIDALKSSIEKKPKDDNGEPVITISIDRTDPTDSYPSAVPTVKSEPVIKNEQQKPKRSIFDLDFEDDEDPLQTLIAEVAAASSISRTEDEIPRYVADTSSNDICILDHTGTSKDSEFHVQQYEAANEQLLSSHNTPMPPPVLPTYKIKEDDTCLAKHRFELQVQEITNFHIRALHNCYIPNVNGNWDSVPLPKNNVRDISVNCATETFQLDGSNVVPKYCSIDNVEHIKKDLREINFYRNFKPRPRPKAVERLFYQKPFLGVSRCLKSLKSSHRKTRKHRQKLGPIEPRDIGLLKCPVNETVEIMEKVDNGNIILESNVLLDCDSSKALKHSDESNIDNRCSEMINNPPLKLLFNDITINVGETLEPILKGSAPAQAPTLLAIATTVNFNNNQIENNFAGENEPAQKSCANQLEEETANMDLNAEDGRIAFSSDIGDIRNNNNCNDKLEESSCESHSSLKQTQKSINLKLRKHRRQIIEQEQNSSKSYSKRKRRRKKSSGRIKRQKIKCIKIAINGGITTQRHIEMGNISNDDSESDSYGSDLDGTEKNVLHDFQTEIEISDNSDAEKDIDFSFKSSESEWEESKNASISVHGDVDEENYECYDDDELEDDDEYSGEFHEVVTRDISPSSESGNNHIVLTIKKTPSKTNSPCSSLPPGSPVVLGYKVLPNNPIIDKVEEKPGEIQETQTFEKELNKKFTDPEKPTTIEITAVEIQNHPSITATSNKTAESMAYTNLIKNHKLKRSLFKHKRRILKRKSRECKPFQFLDDFKKNSDGHGQVFKKLHQQLFFPHEMFVETAGGSKRRIFDTSSCRSSCAELSEYEYESFSDREVKSDKVEEIFDVSNPNSKILPISSESKSSGELTTADNSDDESDVETEVEEEHLNFSDSKIESKENFNEHKDYNEVLSEDNNGRLASFNNIFTPSSALKVSNDSAAKMKCDELCRKDLNSSEDYGKVMDHGINADSINFEAIGNNENKSQSMPRFKYNTDKNAVNEDANEEQGTNYSRSQQFKEWHQLLQLRSYNDELLTVLPYVVLD